LTSQTVVKISSPKNQPFDHYVDAGRAPLHKIKDKKPGGYFLGQNIVVLYFVSK